MSDAAGRIILVCKLKGGAGATTTCRELAVAAVASGLQVALVDLDSQGGLTRWWSRRTKDVGADNANPQLLELPADRIAGAAVQLRQRFGVTVIDSPPTVHETIRAVAGSADLALIPARPTVDDLDAVGPIARLLRGVVDMGFVLTQVPGGRRSRDGAEALERLAGLAPAHQPAPRLSTPSRRGQHRFRGWRDGAGRDCGAVAGHTRKVRHHAS